MPVLHSRTLIPACGGLSESRRSDGILEHRGACCIQTRGKESPSDASFVAHQSAGSTGKGEAKTLPAQGALYDGRPDLVFPLLLLHGRYRDVARTQAARHLPCGLKRGGGLSCLHGEDVHLEEGHSRQARSLGDLDCYCYCRVQQGPSCILLLFVRQAQWTLGGIGGTV